MAHIATLVPCLAGKVAGGDTNKIFFSFSLSLKSTHIHLLLVSYVPYEIERNQNQNQQWQRAALSASSPNKCYCLVFHKETLGFVSI